MNVGMIVLVVLAVVVMVNYLSQDYFKRFHLSALSKHELSPLTLKLLKSLTNEVKVTLYYDQNDQLYETLTELLNEYKLANPRISVQTVDYLRNPGGAQKLKATYKLAATTDKNLVIFECERRILPVDGKTLAQYVLEQVPNEKEREFRRKPTAFEGEKMFTSALLAVTSPRPLNAYFLEGHDEHQIGSQEEGGAGYPGYLKFATLLHENYIATQSILLLGTNGVPPDCNLLVIAGPRRTLQESEVEKIDQYLAQGGRLLLLLNSAAREESGMDKLLARWGVQMASNPITDPEQRLSGDDVIVSAFSKNPLVNPLVGYGLYLVRPRPVGKLSLRTQAADAPKAEEIAFSGEHAFYEGDKERKPRRFPLMVAVEKGTIKGVTERGATRMIVAGDSIFLANHQIDLLANRDFAECALNWLVDRTQLVEGIAERPVIEFRLAMTRAQRQAADWLLLGAMPGAVLAMGCLVWVRRRR
jgi:hypothetical protein